MLQTNTRHHTLGVSRAGTATRIWLEGKRLIANGFAHGMPCERQWSQGRLTIVPASPAAWDALDRQNRSTVAGTPMRPILDITGEQIARTFPTGRVMVMWSHNRIVIEGV